MVMRWNSLFAGSIEIVSLVHFWKKNDDDFQYRFVSQL